MARLLVLGLSVLSISLFAGFKSETIKHEIKSASSSVVKDGKMKIHYSDVDVDYVKIHIDYRFVYRIFFSNKVKQGVETEVVPRKYTTLDGYLELEREGRFTDKSVTMIYLKRVDFKASSGRMYYDCHKVRLIPQPSQKAMTWEATFTYCPEVPSVGWANVALTIKRVPFLGSITVNSEYTGLVKK
tara:strand:+ start:210342 stop:210899 length:558 start_codon:yes stop_codon:yes gene_type:complete